MAPINKIRELRALAKLKAEKKEEEQLLEAKDKEIDADGLTYKQLERLLPFTGGKNGKGKYYTRWYDNGSRYMGEYKEEEHWHKRKCKWTNMHRTPHGMGKFYLQNRDNMFSSNEDNEHLQYIGRWKNGEYHGWGTYFWFTGTEAGNYYNGEFRHGLKHGFGFYSNKNEEKPLECIYFNDKRLAQWSDLYEGRRIKVRFASFSGVGTDWYEI